MRNAASISWQSCLSVTLGCAVIHIGWDDEPKAALKNVRISESFYSIRSLSGAKSPPYGPPACGFRCLDLEWTAQAGDALNRFFSPSLAFLRLSLNGDPLFNAMRPAHQPS